MGAGVPHSPAFPTASLVRALARHGASTTDITARYLHPAREDLRRALAQLEQMIMDTANVVPLRQTGA